MRGGIFSPVEVKGLKGRIENGDDTNLGLKLKRAGKCSVVPSYRGNKPARGRPEPLTGNKTKGLGQRRVQEHEHNNRARKADEKQIGKRNRKNDTRAGEARNRLGEAFP